MGRMWRGGYRRFHPIGDRMENEMVDAFDVGQPICDLDMEYGVYKVPAKEVIPYRIYPVLSPAWKADGYDELGIIYDRYLDLLVTYVVEGESETDGYAAAIVTYDNLDTFGLLFGCYSAIILAYCINGRRIRMEENSFQVALRSALSELKDGSMVELSERDPGFRQSEMEEHLAEQDWLKISHEIPQELRDVTDRFIRAVRVHACDQVDTAYLAGMRDMMKIAAAFGLYEIDPDDVLPAQQRK